MLSRSARQVVVAVLAGIGSASGQSGGDSALRVRVQRPVDRRFNRARYDAERTVAEVEPASASVWIVGGPR